VGLAGLGVPVGLAGLGVPVDLVDLVCLVTKTRRPGRFPSPVRLR